jgi:hypothetical protein
VKSPAFCDCLILLADLLLFVSYIPRTVGNALCYLYWCVSVCLLTGGFGSGPVPCSWPVIHVDRLPVYALGVRSSSPYFCKCALSILPFLDTDGSDSAWAALEHFLKIAKPNPTAHFATVITALQEDSEPGVMSHWQTYTVAALLSAAVFSCTVHCRQIKSKATGLVARYLTRFTSVSGHSCILLATGF